MSLFRKIVIMAGVILATGFSQDYVILDDFSDYYASNPTQTWLGEAYGYALTESEDKADTGGGWWSPYADPDGSVVTNGKGDALTDNTGNGIENDSLQGTIVDSDKKILHVNLKTSESKNQYPYAGIGNDIFKGTEDLFDFSNLAALVVIMKATGKVRLEFLTNDILSLPEDDAWGFYGYNYTPSDTTTPLADRKWDTVSIPIDLLEPEQYSPAADSHWTWAHGMKEVKGFEFLVSRENDSTSTSKDPRDVELMVDAIYLYGMSYETDFGFKLKPKDAISVQKHLANTAMFSVKKDLKNKNVIFNYKVDKKADVNIKLYNVAGKEIYSYVKNNLSAGKYSLTIPFEKYGLSSGVYMAKFISNGVSITRTIKLVK